MAALHISTVVDLPDSHRNSPLAPSQEMAYRQKCIDLKRRLSEIEANNDSLHARLNRERHFQDKMRLNRAILLNHMKELVENRSNYASQPLTDTIPSSSGRRGSGPPEEKASGFIFDDSSEISSSDEAHQDPEERPLRVKRARDGTPRRSAATKRGNPSNTPLAAKSSTIPTYHTSGLPHIVPANAIPPAGPAQPQEAHTAAFRVGSSASNTTTPTPLQPHPAPHQTRHQPPTPTHPTSASTLLPPSTIDTSLPPQPIRPIPPFDQFNAHLVPQLEADNIPAADIEPKIRETWKEIGDHGRKPWELKYRNEMMVYERETDEWKRLQKEGSRGSKFANGAGAGAGAGTGFSAVNRQG